MSPIPGLGGSCADALLPCGTSADVLAAQVTDGAPPDDRHQTGCPYCQSTLTDLRADWEGVKELATEDVRAPASLLAGVRARIRQLPRDTWHVELPAARGGTRISGRIIALVARLAAEEVPGIGVALARGRLLGPDTGSGQGVALTVQITVAYGAPAPEIAQAVRRRVDDALNNQAGLVPARIDVHVMDVAIVDQNGR